MDIKKTRFNETTAYAGYQALARAVEKADYIKKVLTAFGYSILYYYRNQVL